MTTEKIEKDNKILALVTENKKIITDMQSALDVAMSAKYELDTNKIRLRLFLKI